MTVLVTGATGDLGLRLLEVLAERGEALRASTRGRHPVSGPAVEWVRADLLDEPSLRSACRGVRALVHMAALTHSARAAAYYEVNLRGTEKLLEVARGAGVELFLHVSTRALGEAAGAYGHSKALAEERVRASGLDWVIVRPAEVYGTGGRDPVLALARSLRARTWVPVLGDGSYGLCPLHVDDAVAAVARALDRTAARGRTYVLAGPESLGYLDLIERVEALLGVPRRRRLHVPVPLARIAIALASRLGVGPYVPDQIPRLLSEKSTEIGPAIQDLEFAPRRLEVGLGPLLVQPSV